MGCCPQSSPSQHAQAKAEQHQSRVFLTVQRLQTKQRAGRVMTLKSYLVLTFTRKSKLYYEHAFILSFSLFYCFTLLMSFVYFSASQISCYSICFHSNSFVAHENFDAH